MVTREFGGLPACRDHVGDLLATIAEDLDDQIEAAEKDLARRESEIHAEAIRAHVELEGCDVAAYIAEQEASRRPNFVYYMRCGGYVKIGRSTSPTLRLSAVRSGRGLMFPEGMNPAETVLERVEKVSPMMEAERHDQFAHLRVAGEWFRAAPELERHLAQMDAPSAHF